MRIEMVDAVIDEGNSEAPLTYTVDGVRKQIAWSALNDLFEDRFRENDQYQTEEQKLLAVLVCEHWVDSDDWWVGASASNDTPSPDSSQDKEEP